MSAIAATDKLFFERADAALDQAALPKSSIRRCAAATTASFSWSTAKASSISLDDGNIRSANFDSRHGFRAARRRGRGDRLCAFGRNL